MNLLTGSTSFTKSSELLKLPVFLCTWCVGRRAAHVNCQVSFLGLTFFTIGLAKRTGSGSVSLSVVRWVTFIAQCVLLLFLINNCNCYLCLSATLLRNRKGGRCVTLSQLQLYFTVELSPQACRVWNVCAWCHFPSLVGFLKGISDCILSLETPQWSHIGPELCLPPLLWPTLNASPPFPIILSLFSSLSSWFLKQAGFLSFLLNMQLTFFHPTTLLLSDSDSAVWDEAASWEFFLTMWLPKYKFGVPEYTLLGQILIIYFLLDY